MREAALRLILWVVSCTLQISLVRGEFCQHGVNDPKCVSFEWQGCYTDKKRDIVDIYGYEELFRGHVTTNYTEWRLALPGFACKCADVVFQTGLKSFALKFHSVCYGRKEGFNVSANAYTDGSKLNMCIRQNPKKPCSQKQSICIGSRTGVSIYKIMVDNNSSIRTNSYFQCGVYEKHPHSSLSKEESKEALKKIYGRLGKTVDVDEIIDLIRSIIKILKRPEIYRDLTVYTELEETFVDVLSQIVGDKYKEMWIKSQKIQNLVSLVEGVATTLLLSIEIAKKTHSDYYYLTPNIDIAANLSTNNIASINFNDTTRTYISTSSVETFGTAAILYKGIKDFFPSITTGEKRSIKTSKVFRVLASPVISIVAMHDGKIIHGVNGTIRFKIDEDYKISRNSSVEELCVYWNENPNLTLGGSWSTRGLSLIDVIYHRNHSNAMYYTCRTNHLTSFAILMATSEVKISPDHQFALEIITYVGCTISLFCLFLTIVTLPFIRLRDVRFKIHLHLCIALAAAQILFLSGTAAVQHRIACTIVAILLHYFYTVAFMWMLVEGVHLYQKVVIAYEVKTIRKEVYYIIAWGIPFLIVGVAVAVHREGYGTSKWCWLSLDNAFRWSFIGPVLFIMVVNVIILIKVLIVMVNIKANPLKSEKYHKIRVAFKGVVILLPLLGLTWVFGLMSINTETIVFQYLFSFFNSLQGAFIFIFNYVLNKEVRANFRRTLHRTTTTSL